MNPSLPLVSCVMPTYRRFSCVERSIACFLAQDYPNKELIVWNTDVDHELSTYGKLPGVLVMNGNTDSMTGEPYTNTGAIRRDALRYAHGQFYITWDDDDFFFPWNISMCVFNIDLYGGDAWKPRRSLFLQAGCKPELMFNYMEASVIVRMEAMERFGFKDASGPEGLSWFDGIMNSGTFAIGDNHVPGYCFNWSDPPAVGGHKQSDMRTFGTPDNYAIHRERTTDHANGRVLQPKFLYEYPEMLAFVPAFLKLSDMEGWYDYVKPYMPFCK